MRDFETPVAQNPKGKSARIGQVGRREHSVSNRKDAGLASRSGSLSSPGIYGEEIMRDQQHRRDG